MLPGRSEPELSDYEQVRPVSPPLLLHCLCQDAPSAAPPQPGGARPRPVRVPRVQDQQERRRGQPRHGHQPAHCRSQGDVD